MCIYGIVISDVDGCVFSLPLTTDPNANTKAKAYQNLSLILTFPFPVHSQEHDKDRDSPPNLPCFLQVYYCMKWITITTPLHVGRS